MSIKNEDKDVFPKLDDWLVSIKSSHWLRMDALKNDEEEFFACN